MDRELVNVIVILLLLTLCFYICLIITEKRNMDRLRKIYSGQTVDAVENTTEVPAPSEKAFSYHKNRILVSIISNIWSMAITAFFLFSGFSASLGRWAVNINKNLFISAALYYTAYSIINYLLDMPLSFYAGFIRKHSYGLSNQKLNKWIGDSLKGFLLSVVLGSALVWIPYYMIKSYPGYWWLYVGLLFIPFMVFMSYISPTYIDPIFNKYEDVENKELESKIHELLSRTIVGDCRVFQVNKSVDTKEMNAYMAGVFNSKRIVLWDTTINNLTEREVLSIVAHELGHYLMGHVWKMILLGGIGSIFILYLIDRGAVWVLERSGGLFGFETLGDIASIPLLLTVGSLVMFIVSPFANAYSRHNERQADTFELELTKDNSAGASSMVKLHYNSLILPEPGIIYKLWNYSHPAFKERVDFANSYRPWEENRPLKYKKYIVK
jgi:STE24 endopeptidase